MSSKRLELVIVYNALKNRYAICGHNLSPDRAKTAVAKLKANHVNALAVSQQSRHSALNTDECTACRRDVEQASGLEPKPRFERRLVE